MTGKRQAAAILFDPPRIEMVNSTLDDAKACVGQLLCRNAETMMIPRILVADDHPMCSAALAMASRAVNPMAMIHNVATLEEAEEHIRSGPYDLVLLDLMLPDVEGFSGLLLVRTLLPDAQIAIVSSKDSPVVMTQALRHGAAGFLSKTLAMDAMIAAIRQLLQGRRWFPCAIEEAHRGQGGITRVDGIGQLSFAQLRVLRAIARGRQNKQIAFDLGIAEPTVKSHLAAIFRKLGVSNRTQAVLAFRSLDPE